MEPQKQVEHGFFSVEFTVQGQLIHGSQKFTPETSKRNDKKMRGQPEAEVRSTAFKSMLRYWFRVFARGVLHTDQVKLLEGKIFGAIQPHPQHGYLRVRVLNGQVTQPEAQGKSDPCGKEQGTLVLDYSPEVPDDQKGTLANLAKHLVWLMFHLGGIGQGARRPCYSRKTRNRAPWWRGSNLIPENKDTFWERPESAEEFKQKFQQRLQGFYKAIGQLAGRALQPPRLLTVGEVSENRWSEAIDANCCIVVCSGEENFGKPFALAILHHEDLKVPNRQGSKDYNENLCGKGGHPSPVWIANLGN